MERDRRLYFVYGKNLEKKLKEKGILKIVLARILGKSPGAIGCYVNGTSMPTVVTAYKIAKVLNCSIDDFFKEEDDGRDSITRDGNRIATN